MHTNDDGERPSEPVHLEPSELGTKQYWDALYAVELTNHAADPRDEGTVWFDDSDAEAKILAFLDAQTENPAPSSPDRPPSPATETSQHERSQRSSLVLNKATTSFLDLGCGNGSLLFALRDGGWHGQLLGVDYSAGSVELARRIARSRAGAAEEEGGDNEDGGDSGEAAKDDRKEDGRAEQRPPAAQDVDFRVWDVLYGSLDSILPPLSSPPPLASPARTGAGGRGGWDVVLDKGTFDAISLSDERDALGRRVCEGYLGRVLRLVRPGGVFLVTSCNWTEAELVAWFTKGDGLGTENGKGKSYRFEQVGRVDYRSFSFGGVKGQTISTVCFMKRGEYGG